MNDFIVLAKTKLDSNTNLLVGPETALQEAIWESKVNYAESIIELKKLQLEFPKLNILLGASTYKLFKKEEEEVQLLVNLEMKICGTIYIILLFI